MNRPRDEHHAAQLQFVEQVGLFFEGYGLPPMAGRILGWLLICDPPQQSSRELAEVLDASKGSISTNTRMLLASGLVHRTTVAGRRGAFFEVGPNTWREMMEQELAAIRKMRALFDSGLRVLADAPPERRARLEDMNFVYDFIESEWSGLMDRVYEAREAHVRARVAAPKEDPCVD
ncbi:MAG: MarR family transcriptional regulator [Alphaproteobacteria bacterium]|nr:MarR family transcriptional regulator [Alphaproteobacteria bacterium]MCB9794531.1 MarR family transcriptional regulator [Alphaproteobacteria bacterium]